MGWIADSIEEEFYKYTLEKREKECKKNLRDDKIKAILEDKEFVYNNRRHNPDPSWRFGKDDES